MNKLSEFVKDLIKRGIYVSNVDIRNEELAYAFKTENILILPLSRKQIHAEETRRRYCSQCGKKVNPKDKFCSNCGAKLN